MASSPEFQSWQPLAVDHGADILPVVPGLSIHRIEDLETVVVSKTAPGFSPAVVAGLSTLVRAAGAGRLGPLKFLVFDLAHEGFPLSVGAEGFEALLCDLENLILAAPVVTVVSARADLAGADLEFALACNIMIGETGRRYSFAGDATVSVGAYGLLAQKIGFVRAERLMEKGDIIGSAEMCDLYLMKEAIEETGDLSAVEEFLRKTARRHNACYGIYRAQRMAIRPPHEALRA